MTADKYRALVAGMKYSRSVVTSRMEMFVWMTTLSAVGNALFDHSLESYNSFLNDCGYFEPFQET
jgi:hypothetical protein